MKNFKYLIFWVSMIMLCGPILTHGETLIDKKHSESQLSIILGANPVAATETHQYTISNGSGSASWSVTGGTIITQSNTAVTVRWDNPGIGQVSYSPIFDFTQAAQRNITVQSMVAPTPQIEGSCGQAHLTYAGDAPSRVAYFWQTQSNGTSTLNSGRDFYPGSAGTYYLRARNNQGLWGVIQSIVFSDIALSAPTNILTSEVTNTQFRLTWDQVACATGYRVDIATNSSFTIGSFVSGYINQSVSGTTILVSGLQPGQRYFYRVRSENQLGTSNNTTGSLWTTIVVPTPVALAATNVSIEAFTANWGGEPILEGTYLLDVATDPAFSQYIINVATGADFKDVVTPSLSSYISGSLSRGITYYYRVRAKVGSSLSDYSNVMEATTLLNSPAQDGDLNWVESTTYDNTGPVGVSKTYFDYKGKLLQAQTKNYTENKVLATGTLYDHFLRPAVKTLAAPIDGVEFAYQDRFISSNNGDVYEYSKWENRDPVPLDDAYSGTLGWYYSENNDLEPLTDISPYPFSKSIYYEDGTGEMKTTVAPGDPFMTDPTLRSYSKTFPVFTELDGLYLQIRNLILGENAQTLERNLVKSVSRDANGKEAIVFQDAEGKALVSAYGYVENGVAFPMTINFSADVSMPAFNTIDFHIPESSNSTSVTVNGSVINDLLDDQTISGNNFDQGFYRCFDCTALTYQVNYYNAAFSFYDNQGKLIASVAPKGVEAILDQGLASVDVFDLPFATYYSYDAQGRLIHMREPDTGSTRYIYRKDGSIRFSQNAKQAAQIPKTFSYTNYDRLGRPVESGEYVGTALQFGSEPMFETDLLEAVGYNGGFLAANSVEERKDWVRTYYDVPDSDPTKSLNDYPHPGIISVDSYDPSNTVLQATQRIRLEAPFRVDEGNYFRTEFVEPEIATFDLSANQKFVRGTISYTENENTKTWYSYDEQDRVEWMATWYKGIFDEPKVVQYEYDFLGNVTHVAYQEGKSDAFYHHYIYDEDRRLSEVHASTSSITAPSATTRQAKYHYYLNGPLKRVELANDLQGIDYVYNLRGVLKAINNPDGTDPGGDTNDAFAQLFQYYANDYNRTGLLSNTTVRESQYVGNIAATKWRTSTPSGTSEYGHYDFLYDDRYYLKDAQFRNQSGTLVEAYRVSGLDYDANGNIRNLLRKNGAGSTKHNFTQQGGTEGYVYYDETNQLQSVRNYADYTYNAIGEMVTQTDLSTQNLGVTEVAYDVSGKVVDLKQAGNPAYHYDYDDRGFRNRKQPLSSSNAETIYVRDASGQLLAIYEEQGEAFAVKEMPIYGASRLGTFYKTDGSIQYELKDHLGNVRAVVNRGTQAIDHQSDYYPFGSKMRGSGSGYRYGFQGEYAEDDTEETGWNHFELRAYDAVVGRWLSVDPERQHASPYLSMGNNPISKVDPDGGKDGCPDCGDQNSVFTYASGEYSIDPNSVNSGQFTSVNLETETVTVFNGKFQQLGRNVYVGNSYSFDEYAAFKVAVYDQEFGFVFFKDSGPFHLGLSNTTARYTESIMNFSISFSGPGNTDNFFNRGKDFADFLTRLFELGKKGREWAFEHRTIRTGKIEEYWDPHKKKYRIGEAVIYKAGFWDTGYGHEFLRESDNKSTIPPWANSN